MASLVNEKLRGGASELAAPLNEQSRSQVWNLLSGMYPTVSINERRREQRFPYPRLFVLTPVEPDTLEQIGPALTAAGKHLSESGISFYHPEPLPYRWVIATVDNVDTLTYSFLVDLDWCRFTRQGWYESGGRFLRAVTSAGTSGP